MALAGMGVVLGVVLLFVVLPKSLQGEEALREDLLRASTLQARHGPRSAAQRVLSLHSSALCLAPRRANDAG